MDIQRMNLSSLKGADYNPRNDLQPRDAQFQKIKRSIQEFGCVEPIIWNKRTSNVVGGHQRLKVLRSLGETQADVVVIDCSLRDEKILNLTLNRTKGRWDNEKLAALMQELHQAGQVELTGFDEWELQGLFEDYTQLDDILAYDQPEDGGGDGEEPKEPDTFEISFQIPREYAEELQLFMDTADQPQKQLAAAVINFVKMGE